MHLLNEQQADNAGFKLLDFKASGGSAIVYKARHKATEQAVALKLLKPGGDPLRIQREARVLDTLRHANIATLVAAGEIGPMAYLATLWIEGASLRQWLDQESQSEQSLLDIDLVLSILSTLTSALTHAHSHGITHGDISPCNILVSKNLEAHLIDFGVGRATSEQTVTLTSELAGTPRYLAPELIAGDSPSIASDQYALAIVTYEMLTGQWPYSAHKPSAATALHHQLYSHPASICELRPDLPVSMEHVFNKALSKNPGQRFKTISCFHDAFSQSASSVPILNRRPSSIPGKLRGSAVALLFGAVMITSIWWTHQKSLVPLLASVATAQDHIQSDATAATNNEIQRDNLCNLYTNSEFNSELDVNFYRDANVSELATRVKYPDAASSPKLQLGDIDQYGLYGIILNIQSGQTYSYSADLMFRGYVHIAQFKILWLDEFWQTIEGEDEQLTIERHFDSTFHLSNVTAPKTAHYAIPTLYKDASAGIVYVDNVVFSVADQACKWQ